jgi:hypothetical protein
MGLLGLLLHQIISKIMSNLKYIMEYMEITQI